MSEAHIEGQRAGRLGLSPSLNPYELGTPPFAEWESGRLAALTSPVCRYRQAVVCNCGGRGLCLDVA